MKSLNYLIISISLFFMSEQALAQSTLTDSLKLSDVVFLALEENNLIQIQKIETEIAKNEMTPGNAGYLPSLSLSSDLEYQNSSAELLLRTFQPNPPTISIDESQVTSTTFNSSLELNYTLFDGFERRNRYNILKHSGKIAEWNQEAVINSIVMDVTRLFFHLYDLQEQERLLEEIVQTSQERITTIERRFELGSIDGLTLLQAKANMNRDLLDLERVRMVKANSRKDLSLLIGKNPEEDFNVIFTPRTFEIESYDLIQESVLSNNPEIQLAMLGINIEKSNLEIQKSAYYPTLTSFARLNYFNQNNDIQQVAEIETFGPQIGISFRMSLFSGGRNKIAIQNKRLSLKASEQRKLFIEDQILTEASKEYESLLFLQIQLNKEIENLASFQNSYERVERRFLEGQSTSTEFREAQNSLLNAELIISQIRSSIMVSHYRLQELKGDFVN